jgi:hypothetical protein
MWTDSLRIALDRRGALGLGAAGLVAGAVQAATGGPDLTDPAVHLDLFRRFSASSVDGAEAIIHYTGVTFGMVEDTKVVPLYGMVGITPARSFREADGTVRLLINEVAMHTDLATGEVIDSWRNPFTDETVEVWHLRNGPLNLPINPRTRVETGGWKLLLKPGDAPREGFYVPVVIEDDHLLMVMDGQATRKNPLQPTEWPRESSGPELVYSEHNTWRARLADVRNPKIGSLPFFANWHSIKPWRTWMLMGQRPGRIYNHLRARKIASLAEVPRPVLRYAEKHFPDFLAAPRTWTGSYEDDWTHFRRQRKPKPL